jgi:hypothetical protein
VLPLLPDRPRAALAVFFGGRLSSQDVRVLRSYRLIAWSQDAWVLTPHGVHVAKHYDFLASVVSSGVVPTHARSATENP